MRLDPGIWSVVVAGADYEALSDYIDTLGAGVAWELGAAEYGDDSGQREVFVRARVAVDWSPPVEATEPVEVDDPQSGDDVEPGDAPYSRPGGPGSGLIDGRSLATTVLATVLGAWIVYQLGFNRRGRR